MSKFSSIIFPFHVMSAPVSQCHEAEIRHETNPTEDFKKRMDRIHASQTGYSALFGHLNAVIGQLRAKYPDVNRDGSVSEVSSTTTATATTTTTTSKSENGHQTSPLNLRTGHQSSYPNSSTGNQASPLQPKVENQTSPLNLRTGQQTTSLHSLAGNQTSPLNLRTSYQASYPNSPTENQETSSNTQTENQTPSSTITYYKRTITPEEKIAMDIDNQPKIYEYPKLINENVETPVVQIGHNGTKLDARIFFQINWSNAATATRTLLTHIFSGEVLASHTLTGKPSPAFYGRERPPKMRLDPLITADITHCVVVKCDCNERTVRSAITTKCADAAKKYRRRTEKLLRSSQIN